MACMKVARVIPIPNVNNPTEFGYLRSISVLPVLSKVLERAIESQVMAHEILPSKQSDFRRGYSCAATLSGLVWLSL